MGENEGQSKSAGAGKNDPILEDHRTLNEILERVDRIEDLAELITSLETMYSFLDEHFASEEAPEGMYEVIRTNAPRHLPHVQKLVEDHRALLQEISVVRDDARACLEGPVKEVLRAAQELAGRLRKHESQETEMFMDAMYTDLGETD